MSKSIKKVLSEILTSGCDERIFLRDETQANKYHLNPVDFEDLFHRGSCTCGTLTPFAEEIAIDFANNYQESNYSQILKNQTKRLQFLLRESDENQFHVYYGPSGSDLMYFPLLFQAIINPNKPIINIVSCPEELGSGSKAAAKGQFYSEWNQFGERIPVGKNITGSIKSSVHFLPARSLEGSVLDRKKAIKELIQQHPDQPIIGNLVFGSKSGIKDDLDIIDEFSQGVMWVVDMCQFRTDRKLIHELINKGVMIMVTGSKFYQAPPFCGALLVPKLWSDLMSKLDAQVAVGLRKIFCVSDIPLAMENIRKHLIDFKNQGLRMRWEIALREMEEYMSFDSSETNALIRRWSQVVIGRLALSDSFRLMPDVELTNDSIVSFMVLDNGRALNNKELKNLFDRIITERHEGLLGFHRVFIGQPVQYGDKSFIRLAIGSYSVRKQMEKKKFDPKNDIRLIEIIEEYVGKIHSV